MPSDADTTELLPKRCGHDVAAATQAKVASMMPDEGCSYARTITLDISTVRPHVSGPNGVKVITSVDEMESRKLKIDKAYVPTALHCRVLCLVGWCARTSYLLGRSTCTCVYGRCALSFFLGGVGFGAFLL